MVLLTIVHFLQFILLFLICSSVLLLFSYSVISACDPMIRSRTRSLSFSMSWTWLKFMSIQSVMPSTHLILCCLHFFFPSSFPKAASFPMSRLFPSGGQNFGVQLQHQIFPWIFRVDSLQQWLVWSLFCPGHSQESSPAPHFQSINFSALSLLYGPALTSTHDHWEKHSFD